MSEAFAAAMMLIRKPVHEVMEAFIDPAITVNFWFTKSSGRLEPGARVLWTWEMYNVSSDVIVTDIVPGEQISIEWSPAGKDTFTPVDFYFQAVGDTSTYVNIKHHGFTETGDRLIDLVRASTGGFTTVLDGLKAYLEHGINLGLIADKFPKEVTQHGN